MNFSVWIEAARPRTLAAAFVPVAVGAALAYRDDVLEPVITGLALICAFLIQIGTNFANDYFDHQSGADTDERIGFTRATAAGLIRPQTMLRATLVTFTAAFLIGLFIVWQTGWIVLLIGVLCILAGFAYTGGPFPLAYNGLGDLFVFIFFGIIAVTTTYYINALTWSMESFWASLAVGALAVNILVINNLRDTETDRSAGKNTLGVLLGDQALRWEYLLMLMVAFAIPPHFFVQEGYGWFIFLPFLCLPLAAKLVYHVWTETEKYRFNLLLEHTARFMALFGVLLAAAIVFDV